MRLKETKEIFLGALDHDPGDERMTFLRDSCGTDEDLLGQVQALLDAHEEEDDRFDFLTASRSSSNGKDIFPLTALNKDRENLEIGVIGDYELLEVIGRGAMGIVYRANQLSLNREVAVKMIRGSFLATESDVSRFRQEAEAAANLHHPNIIPIYEVRELDEVVFFSMELLDGGSMSDCMKELRRDLRGTVEKLAFIARALHVAHLNGIIHRDVKPSNILLDDEGTPFLTDFGLAKNTTSELEHTLSGHLIGTPSYMAPEQAAKNEPLTILADIYSLGAVLYEVITGKAPFTGESLMQVLEQLRESTPESPSRFDSRVDRDLETIAMKCLERLPGDRYPSADTLADELERWLRGDPIEARTVGRFTRTTRWIKRQPVLAGLIAVVAMLLLTLAIGGPLSALRESRLKQEAEESEALTKKARDQLRRELYASEMRLAFQIAEQPEAIPQIRSMLDRWEDDSDLRGWEWDYLQGLTRRGIFDSPSGHGERALPSWRPGTDQILVRYQLRNDSADLWNWKTNQLEKSMGAPSGTLEWDANGKALITGEDGRKQLFDIEQGSTQLLLAAC